MPVTGGLATAAVLGGTSLLGGILGSNSAEKAAEAQAAAARHAADLQHQQYEETRADLSPYRDNGVAAGSTYRDALGLNGTDAATAAWNRYTQSPALNVMLGRIRDNVQASNAARGGLFSGATAQGITDRSTDAYLADSNNWLGNLRDLYGTGESAAAQTGTLGAQSANAQGNDLLAAGNATAAGAINSANSYNNAAGNLASIYGAYQGGAFNTNKKNGFGYP